ncbi:putative membrane protein [Propionispora sp. 2/2-37]|nr:putative membrane protein [Propionispora sp. 2/2-37]
MLKLMKQGGTSHCFNRSHRKFYVNKKTRAMDNANSQLFQKDKRYLVAARLMKGLVMLPVHVITIYVVCRRIIGKLK